MGFSQKPRHARAEHSVEAFLGDEAGAEKDHDIRTNAAQTTKGLFAVHERHGEVEQDQVEMGRTFPEKIQALETRLRGHDFKTCFHKHAFGKNESHRLVVDDQKGSTFWAAGGGRGDLLFPAKEASSGWNRTFLSDPPACSTSCAVTLAARSTLVRSISKYFSEPSLPSQMFSMAALVPEIISSRLFSSLVAAVGGWLG